MYKIWKCFKKMILLYSWLPTRTYCKIWWYLNYKILWLMAKFGPFFPWKILCRKFKIIFLGWNLAKKIHAPNWNSQYLRVVLHPRHCANVHNKPFYSCLWRCSNHPSIPHYIFILMWKFCTHNNTNSLTPNSFRTSFHLVM